jgi:hypothetical protein
MSTLNVILNGARGGQGTSTVAAILALYAAGHVDTELIASEPAATAALLGITLDGETAQVTDRLILAAALTATPAVRIVDAAHAEVDPVEAVVRLVVLRGPCYLALRTLVTASMPAVDGIVVVAEPGRSLTARDVADVAGVPVVATVVASPTVARTIDAGLLVARLHHLPDFAPLARYLTHLLGREGLLAPSGELPAAHRGSVADLNDRSLCSVDMTGTVRMAWPAPVRRLVRGSSASAWKTVPQDGGSRPCR